jgi:hypothetical protein
MKAPGRRRLVGLALLALMVMGPAAAAVTNNGGTVRILGDIATDEQVAFTLAFADAMLSAKRDAEIDLVLDSPGGDIRGALGVVRVIRAAQAYGTRVHADVPQGAECSSACVAILAVADRRTMAVDSELVVHGISYVGPRGDVADEIRAYGEESLGVIEAADSRFGRFLRENHVIDRNIELRFSGGDLSAAFGGFVQSDD